MDALHMYLVQITTKGSWNLKLYCGKMNNWPRNPHGTSQCGMHGYVRKIRACFWPLESQ